MLIDISRLSHNAFLKKNKQERGSKVLMGKGRNVETRMSTSAESRSRAHQVVVILEGVVQRRNPLAVPVYQHIPFLPKTGRLHGKETDQINTDRCNLSNRNSYDIQTLGVTVLCIPPILIGKTMLIAVIYLWWRKLCKQIRKVYILCKEIWDSASTVTELNLMDDFYIKHIRNILGVPLSLAVNEPLYPQDFLTSARFSISHLLRIFMANTLSVFFTFTTATWRAQARWLQRLGLRWQPIPWGAARNRSVSRICETTSCASTC